MKHLGDITKIKGSDVPIVDIVCGGSPCQDLSVAGRREGLAGARSGLFMEQIRIIKEMRNECVRQLSMRGTDKPIRPRFMVWENVPGAFSSNGGEDFRAVLEETARVADENAVIPRLTEKQKWSTSGCIMGDGWSIAWRVHDAQFWGVPQRRKRIALVADFGGESAPEILFEREGMSGDSAESEAERETTSGSAGKSTDGAISFQERAGKPGGGKGILIQHERTGALSTLNNQSVMTRSRLNPWDVQSKSVFSENSVCHSLCSGTTEGMNIQPCVLQNVQKVYGTLYSMGHDIRSAKFTDDEITDPLTATDYKDPIKINDCRKTYQDITGTLDCGITKGTGNQLANQDMFIANSSVVRRLTPMECERLQGFPDRWTDIGEWIDSKGKKHKDADSPRYKALGNSIALPFWEWMAKRIICELDTDHPTMASLFDGIGGFPLVFGRNGCEPVWASEIEEFPIAVTKLRFPEEE